MKVCFVVPSNKVVDFYGFWPGKAALAEDAVGQFLPRYELPATAEGAEQRPALEYDPSWQQLIPYVIVRRADGKILTYRRPDSGDEERLRGQLSIGLGGHIEPQDARTAGYPENDVQNIWNLLMIAAWREVAEEAGSNATMQSKLLGMIRNSDTAVGAVHTGILIQFTQTGCGEINPNDELSEVQWLDLAELYAIANKPKTDAEPGFETWSEFAIRALTKGKPVQPQTPESTDAPQPGKSSDEHPEALPQLDERGMEVRKYHGDDPGLPGEPGWPGESGPAGPDFSDSPEQIEDRGQRVEDLTGGTIAAADTYVLSDTPTSTPVLSDEPTQETSPTSDEKKE